MSNITTFVCLFALLLTTAGCKKWLDVSPDTQVREKELFENERGFKDALTGVYLYLGGTSTYGQNLTMGMLDAMAQRYNTSSPSHPFNKASLYQYSDAATKANIAAIWSGMYTAVGNLNNILTQVDDRRNLFTGNNFNFIKGEALALRALLHFDLVRLFGLAPVADSNSKAIPYPKTFGKTVYPLLTVKQVLDECMKDLVEAEQLLSVDKTVRTNYATDIFLSYTRNRMNYWAVKGLQARLSLYRGDKTSALAAALEVINNGASSFPWVTGSQASTTTNRDRLYSNELLFALYVPKLNASVDALFKTTVVAGTPSLFTSKTNTESLYETAAGGSSDFRFNYLFTLYTSGYSTTKYWQDNITAGWDYLQNLVPVIRLSEVYYIAAESTPVTATGVGYLNSVRTNRGLAALPTSMDDQTLQNEIVKEYKKETYAEGQLFYYFKRKNAARVDGSTINMNNTTWAFALPETEVEFANRF